MRTSARCWRRTSAPGARACRAQRCRTRDALLPRRARRCRSAPRGGRELHGAPPHANRLLADDVDPEVRAELAQQDRPPVARPSRHPNASTSAELTLETCNGSPTTSSRACAPRSPKRSSISTACRTMSSLRSPAILRRSSRSRSSNIRRSCPTTTCVEIVASARAQGATRRRGPPPRADRNASPRRSSPRSTFRRWRRSSPIRRRASAKRRWTKSSITRASDRALARAPGDAHRSFAARAQAHRRVRGRCADRAALPRATASTRRRGRICSRALKARLEKDAAKRARPRNAHMTKCRRARERPAGRRLRRGRCRHRQARHGRSKRSPALIALAPRAAIEKIFAARNAKAVTALAWHAGLSMRTAFKIQTMLLKLHGDELLPARAGRRLSTLGRRDALAPVLFRVCRRGLQSFVADAGGIAAPPCVHGGRAKPDWLSPRLAQFSRPVTSNSTSVVQKARVAADQARAVRAFGQKIDLVGGRAARRCTRAHTLAATFHQPREFQSVPVAVRRWRHRTACRSRCRWHSPRASRSARRRLPARRTDRPGSRWARSSAALRNAAARWSVFGPAGASAAPTAIAVVGKEALDTRRAGWRRGRRSWRFSVKLVVQSALAAHLDRGKGQAVGVGIAARGHGDRRVQRKIRQPWRTGWHCRPRRACGPACASDERA